VVGRCQPPHNRAGVKESQTGVFEREKNDSCCEKKAIDRDRKKSEKIWRRWGGEQNLGQQRSLFGGLYKKLRVLGSCRRERNKTRDEQNQKERRRTEIRT